MLSLLLACLTAPDGPATDGEPTRPLEDSGEPAIPRLPVRLALPLLERDLFETVVGVDHDPTVQDGSVLGRTVCSDYLGRAFPYCYDEHDGTDYILKGGFSQMDAGSATVLAAAAGVVLSIEDGHYDRCHGDATTGEVDCDGHEMVANHVILAHTGEDGSAWRSWYWHLKMDSLRVKPGQEVAQGEALALVGSSGYSSLPHLHFELHRVHENGSEEGVDPYAGPYSQPETGWCAQGFKDQLPGDCPTAAAAE